MINGWNRFFNYKTCSPILKALAGEGVLSRCRTDGACVLVAYGFLSRCRPAGTFAEGEIESEMVSNSTNCYESRKDETIIEKQ